MAKRNHRYSVRAFCDCCGKEVVDGECNVLSDRDVGEGDKAQIFIACKSGCTKRLDPSSALANQELGRCVLNLIYNAKINIGRQSELALMFDFEEGV